MSESVTILITAGPSGGHVFPALTSAVMLAARDVRIVCVWPREIERRFLAARTKEDLLPPFSEKNKIVLLSAPSSMLQSIPHAASVVKRFRPRLVIGFGGRQTLPYLMMAKAVRAAVFIHEQNVRLGRANRLTSLMADVVMSSFPVEVVRPGRTVERRMIHVGLPTLWAADDQPSAGGSEEGTETRKRLGLDPRKPVLLIIGGSQGSRALSECVWAALGRRAGQSTWQVVHLCGLRQEPEHWEKKWRRIGVTAYVTPFSTNMREIYAIVDAAVTRAGANVLTELASFGIPAVMVPYPGAGSHQWDNARYFERLGLGPVWSQERGDADELVLMLNQVLDQRSRRVYFRDRGQALLTRAEIERRLTESVMRVLNR